MTESKILPAGDAALVVEFGKEIDERINGRVQKLAEVVKKEQIRGVLEVVPTFRSLMISYNPCQITYGKLKAKLEKIDIKKKEEETGQKKTLLVPCCYGGSFGPDLEQMEQLLQMSEKEIVDLHTEKDYLIYMLGFLPGFVYLGGMSKKIEVPRLQTPRTVIPARSVGIGGSQTGVYPVESPGGWRLIGRTPLEFYDPKRKPEILCHAGEMIRFVSITEEAYENIRRDVEKGSYQPEYL